MLRALLALTISAFAIGTTEFVADYSRTTGCFCRVWFEYCGI